MVDAHAHIFTQAIPFADNAHSRPVYDYSVEDYIADLDRFGIACGVLSAASLYGDNNDYTLAALQAHSRLRSTIIAKPDIGASTLRAMADRGVIGVRLMWRRMNEFPDLEEEPYRGFFRRIADCGLIVELLAKSGDLPALLPPILESGVRVVVDHFGAPSPGEGAVGPGMDMLLRSVESGRLWVKLSSGFRMPFEVADACTRRLLSEAGPGRLLWGSDAPFVNHEDSTNFENVLALYFRLVPDGDTRSAIDQTALELFFS